MKKIILILLLSMVSSLCFADIWMETKGGMSGIDLANPNNLYNGTAGDFAGMGVVSYSPELHCEDEMIGLVGFSEETQEYKISFEFVGSERWMFTSSDNANYKIPFGIDFVVRARPNSGDDYAVNIPGLGTVISVGYQGNSVPENEYGGEITVNPDSTMKGLWLDMVLVIPPPIRNLGNYGVSDSYQATILIKVTDKNGNQEGLFPFVITGGYGANPSQAALNFSVVPNGNEKSLKLDELRNTDYTPIGRYIYTTTTDDSPYLSSPDSKYSIFVSSAEAPDKTGDKFTLKLEGAYNPDYPGGLKTEVAFEIGLLSAYRESKWFTGTDTINGENFLAGTVIQAKNVNGTYSITNVDEGDIAIRLNDTEAVYNNLAYGNYHAEIYIHLVSNY